MKDHDQSIPLDLLKAARGLMFLTVIKAGVVVSARAGTGLLVARLDSDGDQNDVSKSNIGGNGDRNDDTNDGKQRSMVAPRWSAPCAIGTVVRTCYVWN
jgi:lipid-binding SYLF domain-containing protein